MNPNDKLGRGRASAFQTIPPSINEERMSNNMSPFSQMRMPQETAYNNTSMLLNGNDISMYLLLSMGLQNEAALDLKNCEQEGPLMEAPFNYAVPHARGGSQQTPLANMQLTLYEMQARELEVQQQRHEPEQAGFAAQTEQQMLSAALAERQMLLEAIEQQEGQDRPGFTQLRAQEQGSLANDPLGLIANPLPRLVNRRPKEKQQPGEQDSQKSTVESLWDDDPLGLLVNPLPRPVRRKTYDEEEPHESALQVANRILQVEQELLQQARETMRATDQLLQGHDQEPDTATIHRAAKLQHRHLKRPTSQDDIQLDFKRKRYEEDAADGTLSLQARMARAEAAKQQQDKEMATFEKLAIDQTSELDDIQRRHVQERKKLVERMGLDDSEGAFSANAASRKRRAKMLEWRQHSELEEQRKMQQRERAAVEQDLLSQPQSEGLTKTLADIEKHHSFVADQLRQRHEEERTKLSEAEDRWAQGVESLETLQSQEIKKVRRRHRLDRVDAGRAIAREQQRRKSLSENEAKRRIIDREHGNWLLELGKGSGAEAPKQPSVAERDGMRAFLRQQSDVVLIDDD